MGFDPLTLGLTLAAANAATSAAGAAAQNRAIAKSGRSLNRAELTQRQQLVNAAAQERDKRLREARRIEGRIRAAAAATGRGLDGSFLALTRTNRFETLTDLNIINSNLANSLISQQSQFQARRDQLGASIQSPILAGFTGAIRGLSTGLSIASLASSIPGPPPAGSAAQSAPGLGTSAVPFAPQGPPVGPLQ